MINPFKEVNWNPDRQQKRQFARSLILGFPIMAVAWLLIGRALTGVWPIQIAMWVGAGGMVIGTILWLIPAIAKPFYIVWYGIACSIGTVISNVLLISFYLTVFTVFGIVRRAFGKKALQKGMKKDAVTYWHDVQPVADPKRYYSQF